MNSERYNKKLGPPNIKLAGLQIWVHTRQFPEAGDYWDGNWLNITVYCSANGAKVWTSGPIIHLSELASWVNDCEKLRQELNGEASLDCMEPELKVKLNAEGLGHILMIVQITPNHLEQEHIFRFIIDQSYLTELIKDGRKVLKDFPIKDSGEKVKE